MSNSSNVTQLTLEIDALKARLSTLETKLREELSYPIHAFDVVLRVTTRASTWGENYVDALELENHLNEWIGEIQSLVRLNDPGDSIKVEKVTEVT